MIALYTGAARLDGGAPYDDAFGAAEHLLRMGWDVYPRPQSMTADELTKEPSRNRWGKEHLVRRATWLAVAIAWPTVAIVHGVAVAGCVPGPPQPDAVPATRTEDLPADAAEYLDAGFVWRPGFRHFNGRSTEWVPGKWERPPAR